MTQTQVVEVWVKGVIRNELFIRLKYADETKIWHVEKDHSA